MRAVTFDNGRVLVADRPDPEPGTGEILVRVRAAGLNNADLMQAQGFYPAPPGSPPDILGMELAGEVVGCGPAAMRFSPGDRVMAVVGGGAQAELATFHERQAIPLPESVGWAEAGGFPEVFTTAHDALFTQAGLSPGEHLLVHGAAGGVGTAAVQIAVAAGASVTASVRNPELRRPVAAMGAAVIDPAGFEEAGPYDVILELVGAENLMGNLRSLRTGGRICVIGVGGTGPRGEIDLSLLMGKRARIHGSTLRARPLEGKAAAARLVESQLVPLLADGRISPPVAATFPLEAAADAYKRFRAGAKLGKIVLIA
ncbi:MAG: alcohol dehydrogenase catalytic domain-containing protein [Acidimicrobiales bacterium]